MTIRPLTLIEAEYIAHSLALELMNSDDEPIPPFSTRAPGKLESCLAEPFQTFDDKYLHRTFAERAAVLFYLVTKNRCFSNGNKRMAVTLTVLFFYINRRWLSVDPLELYKVACHVAKSKPGERQAVHKAFTAFFNTHQIPRT
jgi:death-on-curing protein